MSARRRSFIGRRRRVLGTVGLALVLAACAGGEPSTVGDASRTASPVASTSAVATTTAPTTTAPTTTAPSTTAPSTTAAPTTETVPDVPTVSFPTDRALRVLIVGDSVGASLAGPTDRERIELGGRMIEVGNVAGVACPVILDGSWWFTDGSTIRNPTCDRSDRYDDEIGEFRPDVVLAVFGWPGAGGGQRFSDGSVAVPCDDRFDRAWVTGYRELIERIEPTAQVVVTTIAPISMDARRRETGCLNELVRSLPAPVLDLQDWLCPDLDCELRAELRTDGVHYADERQLRIAALTGILTELVTSI